MGFLRNSKIELLLGISKVSVSLQSFILAPWSSNYFNFVYEHPFYQIADFLLCQLYFFDMFFFWKILKLEFFCQFKVSYAGRSAQE